MKMDKILVVLPHPDDEVFPMSGTLSKLISEGSHVTYVCLTLGEMGRNLGNPPFANRVTLPFAREKELRKSCEVIGIQDLRLFGFHDKTIEFEPYDYIDGRILEVINEVDPDVIFFLFFILDTVFIQTIMHAVQQSFERLMLWSHRCVQQFFALHSQRIMILESLK